MAGGEGALEPAFLICIDTEGDDVWSRPRRVETRNAAFLPRFQALCEKFGFIPTYLVNYEMVSDPAFVEFGRDCLKRDVAEIGMHLHAWDTPPIEALGPADWFDQPYATEYPEELIERKARHMTALLEDAFGRKMTSHRAGRFGFSTAYARALLRLGYEVDCSVTPRVSWAAHKGFRGGRGGVDFRAFPDFSYWIDPEDIARPGTSRLLEAPMTIVERERPWPRELARRLLGRFEPRTAWLRPEGDNLRTMLDIVARKRREGADYVQFTLHSSEFMPGGSPTFRSPASIESLYRDMEVLFSDIAAHFRGSGLTDYARSRAARRQTSASLST